MISAASEARLSEIHDYSDYLSVERFLDFSRQRSIHYQKADALLRGKTWRNNAHTSLVRSNVRGKNLLIGHSARAMSVSLLLSLKILKGFRRAFVTNLTHHGLLAEFFGLTRLPIGLCPATDESELHQVYGDQSVMLQAWQTTPAPRTTAELTTIYSNFSVWTAPHHRLALDELVQSVPHVIRTTPSATAESRLDFLSQIRRSGLAICPEGRGQDTHRLYEILYMGALPIVLKGNYQWQLCRTFGWPVIGLGSWEELKDLNRIRRIAESEDFTAKGLDSLGFSNWVKAGGYLFQRQEIIAIRKCSA